jgi:hypothetical protein
VFPTRSPQVVRLYQSSYLAVSTRRCPHAATSQAPTACRSNHTAVPDRVSQRARCCLTWSDTGRAASPRWNGPLAFAEQISGRLTRIYPFQSIMAATPLRFDGESLRRSRSTGDIPTSEVSRPEPAQTSSTFRYSGSHTRSGDSATSAASSSNNASSPRTVAFDDQARAAPSPMAHRNTNSTARRPWSPPPTVAEEPDHEAEPAPPPPVVDEPIPLSPQRRLSLYSRVFAFFGYGRGASRSRKAFVSLFWNLGWGLVQVCCPAILSSLLI